MNDIVLTDERIVSPKFTTLIQWEDYGRVIVRRQNADLWRLGYWLVEGKNSPELAKQLRGESLFRHAARVTGYSEMHMRGAYRVALHFPPEKVIEGASWGMHREVLRVHEELRAPMLIAAVERHQCVEDISDYIDRLAPESKPTDRSNRPTPPKVRQRLAKVKCPFCQETFPITGNKVKHYGRVKGDKS